SWPSPSHGLCAISCRQEGPVPSRFETMPQRLRLCRSVLFLPASNPRAIEKARELRPDMVVLDLEDAVKPSDKEAARHAAVAAANEGFGDSVCAIRLNAVGSPWFGSDAIAMRRCKADYVVLPRVRSRAE